MKNPKKILVIDDDPDIVEVVQLILETDGYDSDSTTKGEEAIDMVRAYKPDLIILDVLLSGNDGRTICTSLKSDAGTKNVPIIMISAHPSAKVSTQECGADSFVAKPFSIDTLLAEVARYLR